MFRLGHSKELSRELVFPTSSRAKNRFPADATNIVVVGLIIVVQVAVVEIHVQGVVSIVGIGSRRPVVVGNGFYSYTYLSSKSLTLFRKTF